MRMVATAYCDRGKTKLGVEARSGIAAADPRWIPLGSTIRVDGLGRHPQTFVVTDTGAAVKGRHVDLFVASCASAKHFGRRPVLVRRVAAAETRPR